MNNKPWEETDFWKNEGQFCSWLRGQFRGIWMDFIPKNEFKDGACIVVTPELRDKHGLHKQTKKAGQCSFCKNWFPKSKLEVDHIEQAGSFSNYEQAMDFLDRLLCSKNNMQLSCKPCHKIKSYAERNGISFNDASIEKTVIAFGKKSISHQKSFLSMKGFSEEQISNDKKRKNCARSFLNDKAQKA